MRILIPTMTPGFHGARAPSGNTYAIADALSAAWRATRRTVGSIYPDRRLRRQHWKQEEDDGAPREGRRRTPRPPTKSEIENNCRTWSHLAGSGYRSRQGAPVAYSTHETRDYLLCGARPTRSNTNMAHTDEGARRWGRSGGARPPPTGWTRASRVGAYGCSVWRGLIESKAS